MQDFDWIWIVFLIIGLGIWLIVTVFRKVEEERQRTLQQQQRPRPDGARRPASDLDRFLEEARRRRGDATPAEPPIRPPARPPARPPDLPWARPVARAPQRQAAPPPAQPPQRQAERPAAVPPSIRRPQTPMTASRPKQSLAPVILEIVPDEEPVTAPPTGQPAVTPTPALQAGGILGGPPTRTVSPIAKQLSEMLGKPQSMATAFVLVEIFGPPVSRKWMP